MSKGLRWFIPVYLFFWAMPGMAQGTYGTGEAAFVPQTNPSAITVDGEMGSGEPWGEALVLDATQRWTGGYYNPPGIGVTPDVEALARVLYANDTLYVFYRYEDYELYIEPEDSSGAAWNSDLLLVGIDPKRDPAYEEPGDFQGWIGHAPDSIYALRFWGGDRGYATIGEDSVVTAASDWVNYAVLTEQDTITVEAAFYVPGLGAGDMIGFNVGGSAATVEHVGVAEERTYAWFSWQFAENTGSDVLNNAKGFGTLIASEVMVGTPIEEEPQNELPSRFSMEQNYPNPFGRNTTIEFGMLRAGNVKLTVYNLLGQKVATLVDGFRAADTYEVRWEVDNLPSGVYLYRLEVDGSVVATKKMTLVR